MKKIKIIGVCILSTLIMACFCACGQSGWEQQESNTEQTTTSTEHKTLLGFFKSLEYEITDQYESFSVGSDIEDNAKAYIYKHDDGTESRVMMFAYEKEWDGVTLDTCYSRFSTDDHFTLHDEYTRDYNSIKNARVATGIFDGDRTKNREEIMAFFEDDNTVYGIVMEDNVDEKEFERFMNSVHY